MSKNSGNSIGTRDTCTLLGLESTGKQALAKSRPTTIKQYVDGAPPESQAHLRKLLAILSSVAPDAEQTMKLNTPFFIEPRFLFSIAAFKAHCCFAPSPDTLKAFEKELKAYKTTKNYLQIPYADPVPEDLVRRIAEYQLKRVQDREDDGFW